MQTTPQEAAALVMRTPCIWLWEEEKQADDQKFGWRLTLGLEQLGITSPGHLTGTTRASTEFILPWPC